MNLQRQQNVSVCNFSDQERCSNTCVAAHLMHSACWPQCTDPTSQKLAPPGMCPLWLSSCSTGPAGQGYTFVTQHTQLQRSWKFTHCKAFDSPRKSSRLAQALHTCPKCRELDLFESQNVSPPNHRKETVPFWRHSRVQDRGQVVCEVGFAGDACEFDVVSSESGLANSCVRACALLQNPVKIPLGHDLSPALSHTVSIKRCSALKQQI